jgi:hypothetical protein
MKLDQIIKAKAEQRRAEDELNTGGTDKYCCRTCFHRLTNSCDGLSSLSKVCEQWYGPDSEIQGLVYWRQEVGFAKNRAGVMQAVGAFLTGKSKPKKQRRAYKKERNGLLW